MRVAFVIYDRFSFCDIAHLYEKYIKKGLHVEICAFRSQVRDDGFLNVIPTKVCEPLDEYDEVVVGGGEGVEVFCGDEIALAWLRSSRYAKKRVAIGEGKKLFERVGFDDFIIRSIKLTRI